MADEQANYPKRIGIIGAGISGLSAAWELSDSGVEVEVFEKEQMPGGLAGWFDVGDTTLEKFYHHIYNKDQPLIQLIEEVGLKDQLVFKSTETGCFYVNRIYRLSSPVDLLRYKPLSFPDRIRLGLLAVRARFIKDWRTLDNISAKEWIIKHSSESVYRVLWEPLFRSKFGRYASEISAAWLWSKFVQRGGSRGKTGAEELGYFKGGYGKLFKELQHQLERRNVKIHLNLPVNEIIMKDDQAIGLLSPQGTHRFDAVLAATQLPDFLSVTPALPVSFKQELETISFLGNTCLVLKLKHRLSDTYWVNITDVTCPFVGVIEQTNLLDESHYSGYHMAYISRYMDVGDPLYSKDIEALFETYLPYLQKIFPEFSREWIIDMYLWREPHAQAVVSVGYSQKIPPARTPVKNLYLTTMAQVFPEDRQMSNGVKLARAAARQMLQDIR
ncbi:NAD(P)/FAD-dependent oxidoreductase [bacterium]|nr:NAD(P)/FAD-dependent oxidoreductase [candidate division CSSED10-310 bacterium]